MKQLHGYLPRIPHSPTDDNSEKDIVAHSWGKRYRIFSQEPIKRVASALETQVANMTAPLSIPAAERIAAERK